MGYYYQSCPCIITNIDTSATMKYILLLKISLIFALVSGLPDIDDQEDKGRRRKALNQHRDDVILEKFSKREIDWDAGTYEFSDLPDEEFLTTHTGLLGNLAYEPESDRFFKK